MTTTEERAADVITTDELVVAADAVINSQRATTSMVQRHVRVGGAKAEQILDRLATAGVIARSGSGDPVVLAKREDLDATLARLLATPPEVADGPAQPTVRPPGIDLAKRPPAPVATPTPATLATPTPAGARPGRAPQLLVARRRAVQVVTTLGGSGAVARGGRAGRVVARGIWVAGQGGISWVHRAANAATHGHLREQVRLARLAGDRARLKEWVELLNDARNDRLDRVLQVPKALFAVLLAVAVVAGVALAVGLLIGVALFFANGAPGWSSWWAGVGAGLAGAAMVVSWLWVLGWWLAGPAVVVLAWREGKRAGSPPMWLMTPDEKRLATTEITPSKVVLALRNLGITTLRNAIKEAEDAGAGILGPIATAGPGVEVDVLLPYGVSTDEVVKRRRKLAENLDRHEHELYLSIPAARTVRLWIADPGALDKPIGPSPLVVDQSVKANLETGRAPLGENLRSDRVGVSLYQRHLSITGVSNHGKTAIIRALALWATFDVRPEFRLADLKGFGDWDMFGPVGGTPGLASVYISGPADGDVIAATEMLEAGVDEMNRRLASGRTDWPHLFLIVDEAQKAYMCPVKDEQGRPYGGKSAKSRFFMAARSLHNQGRAVGVVLWQGTQDPTDENFPKIVREGAHIRMSLVVGTEAQSSMALGEAAVNGGASPHLLRQDIDKGVVVMHGGVEMPRGETSITVRSHFIDTPAAWKVATRALERRRKVGRHTQMVEAGPQVDHLADIHEAMRGEKRVRTVVLLGRLIEENAAVYEPWGADDMAKALRAYVHLGLDIRKTDGQSVVRLEEVETALRERE